MSKKDTAIVLVHEIYGVNQHMKYMKNTLETLLGADVICPNLYQQETAYTYEQEAEAYQAFTQGVGFDHGAQRILDEVATRKQQYQRVGVIGFSVGATIAWLCSEDRTCDFIVGCYGSRIRNDTTLEPVCPTLLIFPTEEKAFDVHTLMETLERKGNRTLQLKSFPGVHGFIDPFNPNYHADSAAEALKSIKDFVQELT